MKTVTTADYVRLRKPDEWHQVIIVTNDEGQHQPLIAWLGERANILKFFDFEYGRLSVVFDGIRIIAHNVLVSCSRESAEKLLVKANLHRGLNIMPRELFTEGPRPENLFCVSEGRLASYIHPKETILRYSDILDSKLIRTIWPEAIPKDLDYALESCKWSQRIDDPSLFRWLVDSGNITERAFPEINAWLKNLIIPEAEATVEDAEAEATKSDKATPTIMAHCSDEPCMAVPLPEYEGIRETLEMFRQIHCEQDRQNHEAAAHGTSVDEFIAQALYEALPTAAYDARYLRAYEPDEMAAPPEPPTEDQ